MSLQDLKQDPVAAFISGEITARNAASFQLKQSEYIHMRFLQEIIEGQRAICDKIDQMNGLLTQATDEQADQAAELVAEVNELTDVVQAESDETQTAISDLIGEVDEIEETLNDVEVSLNEIEANTEPIAP